MGNEGPSREVKGARRLLPWVLLGVAVVAVIAVVRRGPSRPPELIGDSGSWKPGAGNEAVSPKEGGAGAESLMSESELRDFRMHIAHEQCEDGAKLYNTLQGLSPTDPKGTMIVSVCLRAGNLAWYKCMLSAKTKDDGQTCTRRFLNLDNPAF